MILPRTYEVGWWERGAITQQAPGSRAPEPTSRALQWSGNPYGNGYGVEMEWKWSGNGVEMAWKWGTICENLMDWIGFGAEYRLKTI